MPPMTTIVNKDLSGPPPGRPSVPGAALGGDAHKG